MSLLVEYSDSESDVDSESEQVACPKKMKLSEKTDKNPAPKRPQLPLPDSIVKLFDKEEQHEDDSSKHGGRIRTFSHEIGNWATLVFIPYEADNHLTDMVEELLLCLRPLEFNMMDEFHMSLSRTVTIRHHWIQSLVDSLQSKITSLSSFPCEMTKLKFYVNDEKTRSFLALEVASITKTLSRYVQVVDTCFKEFKLQTYYKNPSFHISLAWCVGDVISKISKEKTEELEKIWNTTCDENPELKYFYARKVNCKTGNKVFSFDVTDT
ncbi:U6 snRNA phosphodiesterase 1-like [Mytilus californianus]|uniref:U6 snRNA phosphodiesterase 1-like n=1 Tax=Mytilus californianus TaxID=6549 RepID=UPI0022461D57|nr:U6 snRNA phosphodiesterase 1-like [Mytilus californianus]